MDIHISLIGEVNEKDSIGLDQLRQVIEEECNTICHIERSDLHPGVKDGGLIIGLTIAGLAISAIGVAISALSYWNSRNSNHSILITIGDSRIFLDNIPPQQLDDITTRLKLEGSSTVMTVNIFKK